MPESQEGVLTFDVGREELQIRGRYEVASILNDIVIGLWFAVGSVLFFSSDTSTAATWCFLLGSVQMLVRPAIGLARRVNLKRLSPTHPTDASFDH